MLRIFVAAGVAMLQSRVNPSRVNPSGVRKAELACSGVYRPARIAPPRVLFRTASVLLALLLAVASPAFSGEKDTTPYGEGIIVNVPFPTNQVAQVVQEVVQNGIIRGTKEYNKDEFVSGAVPAKSVKVFPAWNEPGEVFYKVRNHALDPRNFKESNDVGTLAVRYVVLAQGDKNTVLRINAVFVEEFRRAVHLSNGSVESAEYKDIHDKLEQLAEIKTQTEEALREKAEARGEVHGQVISSSNSSPSGPSSSASNPASSNSGPSSSSSSSSATPVPVEAGPTNTVAADHDSSSFEPSSIYLPSPGNGPPQTLDERAKDLRRQVERLVKAPGAAMRSAPFHTASALQSLPAGTEVLIVVTTPYWFGVETHDGQHGWMLRDDLELVP
jgi:hypothetical protein